MSSSELLRQHWHVPPAFIYLSYYAAEGFLHLLVDVKIIRTEMKQRREGGHGRRTYFKIGHL